MKHRIGVVVCGLLFFAGLRAGAQEDLGKELPRIPPREVAAALETFRLHPGFRLELVASEPQVSSPVSVCYDEDGRLYVVEMRGYPYPERAPTGRIVRLEDRDGDGRYEASKTYLDGLNWPTGILPYDGGVFVTVAPDILYAKDTDGDGVADLKKVLFTGFGTDNVQGLLNGLLWGPDGWIYGAGTINGGEIRNLSRPDAKPVSIRGRDFRFRPDGSAFEATSGGGQFGLCLDDWGHRFTCSNSNHIRQVVLPADDLARNPAFVPPAVTTDIASDGAAAPVFRISAAEPWRVVRTRQRAADPEMRKRLAPTELFAIGFFTSASGVTIYRGSAYPEEYRGNAFVGDVGGNLVHRKTLAPDGPIYRADRADQGVEFLASTDNWFRPVNFANTPDGTLLIVDMYRETIEHPKSIPEPIKKHLDLTSGKDRGRLYELMYGKERRTPRRPRLSKASTAELVAHLADPDAWWRETAQRLLIERNDPASLEPLRKLAADRPTALGRLHAIWTLDAMGRMRPGDPPVLASDPDPRLREQGARLVRRGKATDEDLERLLPRLAEDSDAMVRLQAALSLGDAGDAGWASEALASIAVRDADDPWMRSAVFSSIGGRSPAFLRRLGARKGFLAGAAGREWLDGLALLIGARHDRREVRELFESLSAEPGEVERSIAVIAAVGRGARRSGTSLAAVLGGDWPEQVGPIRDWARKIALSDAPAERRASAALCLGMLGASPSLDVLTVLLDARQPSAVQLAALQALGGVDDPSVGPNVVQQWKAMSPAIRREAVEILFARPDRLEALLSAIEARELPSAEIDPARLDQLRKHASERVQARAIKVLGEKTAGTADRRKTVEAFGNAATLPGDAEKGREVHKKVCATCHQVGGQGIAVGPDLATVATRSPDDLLLHILDPNREVSPAYINYNVATVDGRVVTGIIAGESASALTLKRAEGVTEVVPRDQIDAIASAGVSLMPEGLEKGLTAQDLADLIAFVRSIKPAPAGR
ncbi:Cytochrome c [Aquisphaera giovannonii]|uniref:Cytochrome c n=1 Tax=Aquisphaera giovannonii TaxID=406548 RepID=A0A5B9VYC7_9BACT|nr:PVC-type heme-binding CxxCH protein [Aquisphaera giovannonii]QEH33353.1 Cytochrome c [Aquisphaera giovannonii]